MTAREEMLARGLEGLGLPSDERTVTLLGRFADLLLRWNRTYNLTAIREESEVVTHHLLDSAALVPMIAKIAPEAKTLLDVGSGGGTARRSDGASAPGPFRSCGRHGEEKGHLFAAGSD